jgi:hypothetical protein
LIATPSGRFCSNMAELESELEYQVAKANVLEEGNLTAIVGYLPVDQVERLKIGPAETP